MKNTNKYFSKIAFAIIMLTSAQCSIIVAEECRINPYLSPEKLSLIESCIREEEKSLQYLIQQGHGNNSTAQRLLKHLQLLKSIYYGNQDCTLDDLMKW